MTGQPGPSSTPFELGCDGATSIVVRIDDTPASWRAVAYALGLARREAARLIAVYAHTIAPVSYGYFGEVLAAPGRGDDQDTIDRLAGRIGTLAREQQVEATFRSVEGDSVSALVTAADDHCADLIVVGASSKVSHRLFGSTAIRTVRARCCPVTVVP